MKLIKIFLLLATILLPINTLLAEDVVVEAEGIGSTKMEAMNNAWTEAVRKAVGVFLNAKDSVIDDNLTEQISTYSRGRVNSYNVLNESKENGVWKLKISAKIDKDVLQEAKVSTKTSKISANQIAQFATASNQKRDANELIENFDPFANNNIADFLDYQTHTEMGKDGKLRCFHLLSVNDNYKKVFVPQMEKLLSELATKKQKRSLDVSNSGTTLGDRYKYCKDSRLLIHNFKDIITKEKYNIFDNNPNCRLFSIAKKGLLNKDKYNLEALGLDSSFNYNVFIPYEDGGSNDTRLLVYSDDTHCTSYIIPQNILEKMGEKYIKKYEISFVCKTVIDGEGNTYDTPFVNMKFFFTGLKDSFNHSLKLLCCFPWLFTKSKSSYDNNDCSVGGLFLMYIQTLDIPSDKINKIESMEFSYELQEK